MRFQVLDSTVSYSASSTSSPSAIGLSFSVFPWKSGELKFSDGNRLVARDLSEKWGEPLTMGDLYGKNAGHDRDYLNDGGKFPIGAKIILTTQDLNNVSYYEKGNGPVYFLRNDEFACGYAVCNFDKYQGGSELLVFVCVAQDVIMDLLRIRADTPMEMFCDVDIRGLDDEPPAYWPGDFQGTWDLDDASHCGNGDYRVVTAFHFKRVSDFFYDSRDRKRLEAGQTEKIERRQELAKVYSMISSLLAIQEGATDGVVAKLLRLNLLALSAVIIIGILALLVLFF